LGSKTSTSFFQKTQPFFLGSDKGKVASDKGKCSTAVPAVGGGGEKERKGGEGRMKLES